MEKDKNKGFIIYEGKDYYMMEELFFKDYPTNNEAYEGEYSKVDIDVLPIIPKYEDIEDGYFYY